MSDSIENDEEFMKLVETREKLEREIAAVYSYEMLLGEYDDDKRLHNLQLEASRARKEIYRYIDRRVEGAVAQERAKQPISVNKSNTHHIFAVPLPSCFVDNLLKDIKKEILKINSGMLLLKSNHLDVISRSFEDDSSMMIEISFSFVYDNYPEKFAVVLTSDGSPVEVCSAKIAKQLSDKVNKIVRDKYANCL